MYQGYIKGCSWKEIISDTKKTCCTHHLIEKEKLWKYHGGLLSINFDQTDIETRTNQFFNDIRNFNNEQIIKCYSVNQFNIAEEPCYIPSMTQTGFINGQYESICYVNSFFWVIFFDIFFRQLIMNIDCNTIIKNLDNSKDEYISYF